MLILIVDDSRSVRTALGRTLQEHGYEVVMAGNGREAVAMTREFKPDLITMDVQMPEMDGFAACAEIRATEHGRLLPIIFVTGKDTLAERELGFKMGATEFISKKTVSLWDEVARIADRILKPETPFEGSIILVAASDEVSRMIVRSCLLKQGVQLLEALSPQEAMDFACRYQGSLDLAVVDYRFIGMGADNLLVCLRQKLGLIHVPILMLCEAGEREHVLELFRSGASDCIMKPFVKEEFVARAKIHLEARRLVRELSRSVQELERLSKLRDEFVAVASHDLKNPIGAIMGFTELALRDPNLDAEHRHYLEPVISACRFMLELVNDIVELNRNEMAQENFAFIPLNVISVAQLAVSSQQPIAANKGVVLEFCLQAEGALVIEGDANKFHRILNNLLSNAIKFTPKDGRVTLTLKREEGKLHLSVADTGVGIPAPLLPKLFNRFSKASRKGTAGEPGTGLGLSITKQLVERHGGTITVDSVVGSGTRLQLTFPLMQR